MGIAIGSEVFGRISPTFGLSGLFLHFQPSAYNYFSREYDAASYERGKFKGTKANILKNMITLKVVHI